MQALQAEAAVGEVSRIGPCRRRGGGREEGVVGRRDVPCRERPAITLANRWWSAQLAPRDALLGRRRGNPGRGDIRGAACNAVAREHETLGSGSGGPVGRKSASKKAKGVISGIERGGIAKARPLGAVSGPPSPVGGSAHAPFVERPAVMQTPQGIVQGGSGCGEQGAVSTARGGGCQGREWLLCIDAQQRRSEDGSQRLGRRPSAGSASSGRAQGAEHLGAPRSHL